LNQPYSKEDYRKKLAEYHFGSRQVVETLKNEWWQHVREEAVHRENFNVKTVSSSGNYLTNCSRCINAFYWEDSENSYNILRGLKTKNVIDVSGCWEMELSGNMADTIGGYQMKYSVWCQHCRYSEYLDLCIDCEYCFGCVGLKTKKYAILNRQYTKEEYEKLRAQIVESMKRDGGYGKFLPYDMAYSGYNVTQANIFFPETKENIEKLGGYWEDIDETRADGRNTNELPDDIGEVKDDITTQPLICPETGYRFNIATQELSFYRQRSIPLPRLHPDARTLERIGRVSIVTPYPYVCFFCKKDIQAYYPPEWGYKKIACESCYNTEVA
jgi:hypothetical protein